MIRMCDVQIDWVWKIGQCSALGELPRSLRSIKIQGPWSSRFWYILVISSIIKSINFITDPALIAVSWINNNGMVIMKSLTMICILHSRRDMKDIIETTPQSMLKWRSAMHIGSGSVQIPMDLGSPWVNQVTKLCALGIAVRWFWSTKSWWKERTWVQKLPRYLGCNSEPARPWLLNNMNLSILRPCSLIPTTHHFAGYVKAHSHFCWSHPMSCCLKLSYSHT